MTDSTPMEITLADVSERLDRLGIEYMVTGSFAMGMFSTARTTFDLDIVIEIEAGDADRIADEFAGEYYIDPVSVRNAVSSRSMFNIIHNETVVKVDCIVLKPDPLETDKFHRRVLIKMCDRPFWFTTKEDLIVSKLQWARNTHSEMQFRDIRNLLETGVDEAFIMDLVERSRLRDAWKAFEEWKTQAEK